MKCKVMTFNVQHFRNYNYPKENRVDLDFFANYVLSKNADIVGLNEVFNSGPPEYQKQVFRVAEKAKYGHAYFAEAIKLSKTMGYGNALMSKYPFTGESILVPDPMESELNGRYAETRCVLKAEVDLGEKKLTVLSCHFGLNDAEARNAVRTVCEIADSCKTPMLLMGDFNFPPDSPILAPLFERFENTEDFFGRENATFPSDKPKIKIDYIFVRGVKVLQASIQREVISDHCPIVAEIEI